MAHCGTVVAGRGPRSVNTTDEGSGPEELAVTLATGTARRSSSAYPESWC